MNKNNTIYASLNVCQYEFDKNLPQKQEILNNLGNSTSNFLNIYLPANAAFAGAMNDMLYPKNRPFYLPNIPTITLGVNYGVIAYLFKKAEGKDDK
ncbi:MULTISPECIES: hypothetical protein [Helicobacter]|uniref:hypothetical protein n=1 Tax=Helicobacter TaxID=209 RepID=UPI00260C4AEB|nr:hypothetical protein [Helicobacter sp. UBA3407]